MAVEIKIPQVGESITEVIIAKWLKAEGEHVERDEPVVTLETDKVNVEVTSPEAGVLRGITKKENDTATVGEVVATIEAGAASSASSKDSNVSAAPPPLAQPAKDGEDGKKNKQPHDTSDTKVMPSGSDSRVMPAAQRMMAEDKVDASQVQPTGPGGRTLKEDVQKAKSSGGPSLAAKPSAAAGPVQAGPGAEQVVPMTPLRRKVAERLVQAQQTAAILTTFNEVDMTNVMALRKAYQDQFVKKNGIKLGFMSFFVKASIDALRAYPEVNAEIRGTDMIFRNYYDIGVAVGGAKGLVVPVVRRAELLSFAELEKSISEYGARAQAGKLKLEEMQGGTFTISNGGVYGSLMSTPIINPPQSGILGMHTIQERPVGVNGKIELRPMMYLALSYDHRIVDGRGAVSFLKRIKECIEAPDRMLLEI